MDTEVDAIAWDISGEGKGKSEFVYRMEEKKTIGRARNRVCLWSEGRCTDTRDYMRLGNNDDTISQ